MRPTRTREAPAWHSKSLAVEPRVSEYVVQHSQLRDITRNVTRTTSGLSLSVKYFQTRSWTSTPRTPARSRLSEAPRIFIFHGSTLKDYLKCWDRHK